MQGNFLQGRKQWVQGLATMPSMKRMGEDLGRAGHRIWCCGRIPWGCWPMSMNRLAIAGETISHSDLKCYSVTQRTSLLAQLAFTQPPLQAKRCAFLHSRLLLLPTSVLIFKHAIACIKGAFPNHYSHMCIFIPWLMDIWLLSNVWLLQSSYGPGQCVRAQGSSL